MWDARIQTLISAFGHIEADAMVDAGTISASREQKAHGEDGAEHPRDVG